MLESKWTVTYNYDDIRIKVYKNNLSLFALSSFVFFFSYSNAISITSHLLLRRLIMFLLVCKMSECLKQTLPPPPPNTTIYIGKTQKIIWIYISLMIYIDSFYIFQVMVDTSWTKWSPADRLIQLHRLVLCKSLIL